MAKDKDAHDVLDFLKKTFGYKGELIPKTDKKTPDMWVSDDNHKYIIEVKSKNEAEDKITNRHSVLMSGQIFEESTPIVPKNTIDGIIVDGCEQLSSAYVGDFYILWLKLKSFDSEKDMEIAKQTLLGIGNVWDATNNGPVECYYFKNSSFYRNKNILDGIIFEWNGQGAFWINNFSSRYDVIKTCSLIQKLGANDPIEIVNRDGLYIVEGDVNRRNEEEVLDYLKKKYRSKKIKSLTMNQISVAIKVSDVLQE